MCCTFIWINARYNGIPPFSLSCILYMLFAALVTINHKPHRMYNICYILCCATVRCSDVIKMCAMRCFPFEFASHVKSERAIAPFIALVCHKLGFICSIEFNYIILFDRNKQSSNWITWNMSSISTYDNMNMNMNIYSIFLCILS